MVKYKKDHQFIKIKMTLIFIIENSFKNFKTSKDSIKIKLE